MNQLEQTYPFELLPLNYCYDSLEPAISETTLCFHHDKHLATYVNQLNAALLNHPMLQSKSMEWLLCHLSYLPSSIRTKVKNNAGGVYNHDFYFASMTSPCNAKTSLNDLFYNAADETIPTLRPFYQKLICQFGSYDDFRKEFKDAALHVFGSGYAWLVSCHDQSFKILTTANQDTPLCMGYTPLLNIDVWEHAYYLDYQNRRGDYIDAWFSIINWPVVEARYETPHF